MRGRDKLAEIVNGHRLLTRQVVRALETGAPVTVLLPSDGRRDALVAGLLRLNIIHVDTVEDGLGATLRTAARAIGKVPMAVLLPDVPGLATRDIQRVLTAFEQAGGNKVTRATDPQGRPGTPVVIPPRLQPAFATLKGENGGREILANETLTLVPFPDDRATRDLDTPEDWAAWRADHPRNT
jgi:CTP:molybdopterin cytidylyltransferase MocA